MIADRLLAKTVILPNGCVQWTGARTGGGYGNLWHEGRYHGAHRFFYEAFVGEIPEGLVLDHLCRNRLCVNVEHLEPFTNAENLLRGISPAAIAARRTTCIAGHPYTSETLKIEVGGSRRCLICRRANDRRRRPVLARG